MAKYELRIQARELRLKGESVRDIAKTLGVAKSTTSLWVRDIVLSVEQLEKLQKRVVTGSELGRAKGSLVQKQRRLALIELRKKEGTQILNQLNDRELLIGGLALYWAEGSKKQRMTSFCNSDPLLINFMINWLKTVFKIGNDRIQVRIQINEIHRYRELELKKYWHEVTGISLSHFSKTSFIKAKSMKVYDNFDSYYGTLTVKVLRSAEIYYRILGLIHGLSLARVAQLVVAKES